MSNIASLPNPSGRIGWLACLSASLFFFFQFLQMTSFNSVSPELMQTFGLNTAQMGKFSSLYLYGLAISFIPAGIMLDLISSRKLLLLAMLVSILGTFVFSRANTLWLAEVMRFLVGLMHSFAFLGCCRLVARWFPGRMAFAMGCFITIGGLSGGIVAQAPLSLLTTHLGWQEAYLLLALLGVFIWINMFIFLYDSPDQETKITSDSQKISSTRYNLVRVVANRQNWYTALYTCFLDLPIMVLGALWGIVYLTHQNKLDSIEAAGIVSMMYFGNMLGAPIIGLLSDKMDRRRPLMLVGAVASLCLVCVIGFYGGLSIHELTGLFFLLGFFTSTQSLSYPLIVNNNSRVLTTTALGFASMIIMGVGGMFQPLFGWLMGSSLKGVNFLAQIGGSYQLAFSLLPATILISILLTLLLKEKIPLHTTKKSYA